MAVHRRIVVATPDHVRWLAPRLRKEDREECLAASGAEPLLALAASLGFSERAWTLVGKSGNPVGIFGISPGQSEIDRMIWMMATDEIRDNTVQFLRESRWWIEELNRIHPLLWNWVDARNELHIKWLRWNGFTFINPNLSRRVRLHPLRKDHTPCASPSQV
jgi:hypothetical protein